MIVLFSGMFPLYGADTLMSAIWTKYGQDRARLRRPSAQPTNASRDAMPSVSSWVPCRSRDAIMKPVLFWLVVKCVVQIWCARTVEKGEEDWFNNVSHELAMKLMCAPE